MSTRTEKSSSSREVASKDLAASKYGVELANKDPMNGRGEI